ncbi:MTH1187 family thiamine-binding protein [Shouchella sp. 1P09AA]|uniref:MTH1187 family thiamine-binding protein n=1 Tax=unclassified Shouchella TaxID=2893065 RepID=UPI0039A036BB
MAIVDVTIIPIGTNGPSVSRYVANIQELLEELAQTYDIQSQLTPMSTLIEGEVSTLLDVVKRIHEVPFENGIERVATNIRIDDRRDQKASFQSKIDAVQAKMKK